MSIYIYTWQTSIRHIATQKLIYNYTCTFLNCCFYCPKKWVNRSCVELFYHQQTWLHTSTPPVTHSDKAKPCFFAVSPSQILQTVHQQTLNTHQLIVCFGGFWMPNSGWNIIPEILLNSSRYIWSIAWTSMLDFLEREHFKNCFQQTLYWLQ